MEEFDSHVRVTHVGLRNFKAFGDVEQGIRLRPLTLVFGRNNAGKSAIVRLPTLLAGSMRADAPRGLCPEWDGVRFGRSLEHFVHRQVAGRCTVQLGLELYGKRVDILAEIGPGQGADQEVSRLIVDGDGWSWNKPPDANTRSGGILPSSSQLLDLVSSRPVAPPITLATLGQGQRRVTYRGRRTQGAHVILELRELASTLVDRLGPIRAALDFSWDVPIQPPKRVQSTGSDAAALLAWDRLNGDGRMAAVASVWMKRITGIRLTVSDFGGGAARADGFSLLVERDDGRPMNVALAGTGIQQVLPVVVQLVSAMTGNSQAGLVVVEEPETHMHPASHAEIAELLIAASESGASPPILVETHSETLLLRLRRRIAEGTLGPGDPNQRIGIYFVDDFEHPPVIRELRLDDEGFIDDWPQRVFDEDAAERRALSRALEARATS